MLAYLATVELQEAWPVVEKEIVLPVERERAWELMTEEPEEWLADEVELEPEPGAPLRATWDDGEERTGVVEEVEPGRRLRFRWDDDRTGIPSRVEWLLDEVPGGTRIRVLEIPLVPVEVRGWIARGTRTTALARASMLLAA
jgi:uncharacterized protein YndB with AHSA1/START domain